jgi:hypothetical protein
MPRVKKTVAEVRLTGNSSKLPAQELRDRKAEENAPMSLEAQDEAEMLNRLIKKAFSACGRGQTIRNKRNPAFANLAALLKMRAHVLAQPRKPATAEDALKSIDKMLGGNHE